MAVTIQQWKLQGQVLQIYCGKMDKFNWPRMGRHQDASDHLKVSPEANKLIKKVFVEQAQASPGSAKNLETSVCVDLSQHLDENR